VQLAKQFFLAPAFVFALAAPALCQQQGGASISIPEQRGYVAALAGVEFEPPTRPVISVEYGENLHRDVQAYATFSYFENLMTRGLQDDLTTTAQAITALTGDRVEFHGRDRGLVFAAGAKYLIRASEAIRPYVGGGAGVLNIRRTIQEPRLGDVTTAVLGDFGLGEIEFTGVSLTRPMMEAALGVGVVAGQTYIDLGYRYRRAFHMREQLDFSQFAAGIGFKF
jgi:opacity protein-like surface antigen